MDLKTVYKYQLQKADLSRMNIPATGKILSAMVQDNQFVVYILVDEKEIETRKVTFRIVGTGHPINAELNYQFIDTVKLAENLIFHIFYQEEN